MSAHDLELADDEVVPVADLTALFEAVGRLAEVAEPDALARAVDRSSYVVTARDGDGELVGLARCLSDDVTVMHLVDVVVRPDRRGEGIGTTLAVACLRRFGHVERIVAVADADLAGSDAARALGFSPFGGPDGGGPVALMRRFGHDVELD